MFTDIRTRVGIALLCTSSVVALTSAAAAQDAGTETVVVTGSRVIADAANSPTPLTIVTTSQLQATTPTSMSQALNKLPVFVGSYGNGTAAGANYNYGGTALNLRNFGASRTLVLLDGHRGATGNIDGSVNIDVLPQMLMQRVDVVTGGASAVYGSDAVTGVVNFILDKRFTGMKFDVNAGISNYEDAASYNFGVAAGFDLFGGRGHIEGDIRAFHQDGILNNARPRGQENWLLTGSGTAAAPYSPNMVTASQFAYGGKIACTGCAANGQQFIANGIIGPFNPGTATKTGNINIGGDGVDDNFTNATTNESQEESFLRFSYNINDDITAYVQGSATQSYTKNAFIPNYINTGSGTAPNVFYANNPYLPAAAQAALTPTSGGTFQLFEWFNDPNRQAMTEGLDNAYDITAGLDGTIFGKYNWSVFYTHGDDRVKLSDPQNLNLQKFGAANDAVAGASGTVQCYVSTTTFASLYPGCVPTNPFGPTALTSAQFNYIKVDTAYVMENKLDNVGGSISGDIFDDWAGPIKAALSAEARWKSLAINSNANNGPVDCTGLRLCNTNTSIFEQKTLPSLPQVSENVWEVAGEASIPLLKGLPLVQDLSADIAGRYTDYSTSGSVETWKIGLDYHVTDEIRFRGTNSVDIRAPSLYELFQPLVVSNSSTPDIHTQSSNNTKLNTVGNPNLVPEVARTYSGGVVLTPQFAPGLTFSVDYYNINMKNAIGSIGGNSTPIQTVCEQSGGTSIFCSLLVRPLPFSNTTTNNFPTLIRQEGLNAAYQRTEGWDIELDYGFQLGDVWADAPGSVNLRMVANYAPVLESVPFPTSPVTFTSVLATTGASALSTSSKGHVTSFLSYDVGSWGFDLEDRWVAGYPNAYQYGLIYTVPRVNSVNYQDVTINKKFTLDGQTLNGYLSIQNIGNVQQPVAMASFQTYPGIYFGGAGGENGGMYDKIGRYFTLGARANF